MNSKRGVTLIALTTMMLLIVLLTSTLTYISINSMDVKRANEVRADLRTLYDKVEAYYLTTDMLPVTGDGMTINSGAPTSTNKIGSDELPFEKLNKYDSGKYYLIDYDLLDGLKLNYADRAYVINEGSHTIYALDGFYGIEGREYTLPYVNHVNKIVEPD